jgi:hypothetical protein
MATTKNLYIDQGATFSTNVQYIDIYKNPIPLTGYTANCQIRKSYGSANAAAILNTVIYDQTRGNITISLDYGTTANLTAGRYLYDVTATNTNTNSIVRVIEGIMTVNPSVTR